MGSELSAIETAGGQGSRIWLNPLRLALGHIDRLSLAPGGGGAGFEVRATGILKSYYGGALLSLARRWKAQAFWYDWRKNLDDAADQLRIEIDRWFGSNSPVHLVAHSMGGLVCRTFIKRHPDRWKTMWDAAENGKSGGRLVMLGTPNHGSYLMLQAVCGLAGPIRKLAMIDQRHDTAGIIRILNTFIGSFQLLPAPERDPAAEPFYESKTYGDLNVSQSVLDVARAHHRFLSDVIDGERMVYVAGSGQPTLAGLSNASRLRDPAAYLGTNQGDGSVSHALGLLKGVRAYFIEAEHSALTSDATVLAALDDLMTKGSTDLLSGGQMVRGKPRVSQLEPWTEVGRAAVDREAVELSRIQNLSRQLQRQIIPSVRGSDEGATISDFESRSVSSTERRTPRLDCQRFPLIGAVGHRPDRRCGEGPSDDCPPPMSGRDPEGGLPGRVCGRDRGGAPAHRRGVRGPLCGCEPAGGRARDGQGGQSGDLGDRRGAVTVRADPDSVYGTRTAPRRPWHDLFPADERRSRPGAGRGRHGGGRKMRNPRAYRPGPRALLGPEPSRKEAPGDLADWLRQREPVGPAMRGSVGPRAEACSGRDLPREAQDSISAA